MVHARPQAAARQRGRQRGGTSGHCGEPAAGTAGADDRRCRARRRGLADDGVARGQWRNPGDRRHARAGAGGDCRDRLRAQHRSAQPCRRAALPHRAAPRQSQRRLAERTAGRQPRRRACLSGRTDGRAGRSARRRGGDGRAAARPPHRCGAAAAAPVRRWGAARRASSRRPAHGADRHRSPGGLRPCRGKSTTRRRLT